MATSAEVQAHISDVLMAHKPAFEHRNGALVINCECGWTRMLHGYGDDNAITLKVKHHDHLFDVLADGTW
jgi:hypothetical protein